MRDIQARILLPNEIIFFMIFVRICQQERRRHEVVFRFYIPSRKPNYKEYLSFPAKERVF